MHLSRLTIVEITAEVMKDTIHTVYYSPMHFNEIDIEWRNTGLAKHLHSQLVFEKRIDVK